VCHGLSRNNTVRVGEKSGPVLSPLRTKVHEILRQCRRPFVLSNALARFSIWRFVQKIFSIKCQSRRKPNKCKSFLAPINSWGRPQLFYRRLLARFTIRRWQSLVEFCLLISVCEAWQWRLKQNLDRLGKNGGPIWNCLWTKVHDILGLCRRRPVVVNALVRLPISCFVPNI